MCLGSVASCAVERVVWKAAEWKRVMLFGVGGCTDSVVEK